MKERCSPLGEVAQRCGVSRRTIKVWIREMGYNLPPRQSKGRYTILIADWMVERLIEKRSPQIAKVRGVRSEQEVRSSAHANSPSR